MGEWESCAVLWVCAMLAHYLRTGGGRLGLDPVVAGVQVCLDNSVVPALVKSPDGELQPAAETEPHTKRLFAGSTTIATLGWPYKFGWRYSPDVLIPNLTWLVSHSG